MDCKEIPPHLRNMHDITCSELLVKKHSEMNVIGAVQHSSDVTSICASPKHSPGTSYARGGGECLSNIPVNGCLSGLIYPLSMMGDY